VNQKRTLVSAFLILTLLVSLLSGCAASTAPATVEAGPTKVTIAIGIDPLTLDPADETATMAMNIFSSMFDTLVEFDAEMHIKPSLATEWRNVDPTTWEFKLRSGVKFHNGEPVTAEDIAFSLNRIVHPDSKLRRKSFLAGVKEAKVVNESTIQVITSIPLAVVPNLMTYVYIVPKTIVEQDLAKFASAPIGSGPYQFKEWVKNEQTVLAKNPNYWRTPAQIDTVVWRTIPEDFSRISEVKTGGVDVIVFVPPDRVPELEQSSVLRVEKTPGLRTIFAGMNTWNKPFDNVKVRQAMNYAVDKNALITNLLGGFAVQNGSPVSKSVPGFCAQVQPYPYDPAKAKQLLAEAGYPDGFEITLEATPAMYLQDVQIIQAIAGQLEGVGVKVKSNLQEWALYWPRWLGKEVPGFYFLGFGNGLVDSHAIFTSHLWKAGRGLYFNHPELDALVAKGVGTFDTAERNKTYCDAQKFTHEQAPWIFLYDTVDLYAVRNRIEWTARPDEKVLPYLMKVAK
jgi:peptide/nickel transport system substrate-binding protein